MLTVYLCGIPVWFVWERFYAMYVAPRLNGNKPFDYPLWLSFPSSAFWPVNLAFVVVFWGFVFLLRGLNRFGVINLKAMDEKARQSSCLK